MLKNNKGTSYIDISLSILVISFILVFCISFFSVISQKITLDRLADNISYSAALKGSIDETIISELAEFKTKTGIDFTYYFDCEYLSGTSNIQLGDKIDVYIFSNVDLFGLYSFEISAKSSRLSRVYFK